MISVALCTYNGSAFLNDLLKSIRNQSRIPEELIIIDDNSSDDSISILEQFAANTDIDCNIIRNKQNLGVNRSYQMAISACNGDIIIVTDQDDIWDPDRTAIIERSLEGSRKTVLFSDASLINETGKPIATSMWHDLKFNRTKFQKDDLVLIRRNYFTGSCMAMTSDCLSSFADFPSDEMPLYDEWIANISKIDPLISIKLLPQKLVSHRIHELQYTSRWRTPAESPNHNRNAHSHAQYHRIIYRSTLINKILRHFDKTEVKATGYQRAAQFWNKRKELINRRSFRILVQLTLHFLTGSYIKYDGARLRSYLFDVKYYFKSPSSTHGR